MLTFDQLRRANLDRNGKFFPQCADWSPNDWAVAIAGEVGEACNLLKKARRGEKVSMFEVAKELADVVLYVDLLAAKLGLDLDVEVRSKFNEVSERVGAPHRL